MDARINKTKDKIILAFKNLILKMNYKDIVIEDIIKESGIVRSTFYRHFKTKSDVLLAVLKNISAHVFSHVTSEELSHDFSKSSISDYKHFITHIFYHLHDEYKLINAILESEANGFFIDSLKKEVEPFALICIKNNFFKIYNLPQDLMLESILANFIVILKYWSNTGFKTTPETLTEYFIALNYVAAR